MNRLVEIETRQKKSAVRDLAFSVGVGIAALLSVVVAIASL